MNCLTYCPRDIKLKICESLNYFDICSLLQTCRRFWKLFFQQNFWQYLLVAKYQYHVEAGTARKQYLRTTLSAIIDKNLYLRASTSPFSSYQYDKILYVTPTYLRCVLVVRLDKEFTTLFLSETSHGVYPVYYRQHNFLILFTIKSDGTTYICVDTQNGKLVGQPTDKIEIENSTSCQKYNSIQPIWKCLVQSELRLEEYTVTYCNDDIHIRFDLNQGVIAVRKKPVEASVT